MLNIQKSGFFRILVRMPHIQLYLTQGKHIFIFFYFSHNVKYVMLIFLAKRCSGINQIKELNIAEETVCK